MEEVAVGFHAFLILALGGGERSPSRCGRFNTINFYIRWVQIKTFPEISELTGFPQRLTIKITVFPVMTPCSMAEICRRFGRTCCFLRQDRLVFLPSRFPVDGGGRFFFCTMSAHLCQIARRRCILEHVSCLPTLCYWNVYWSVKWPGIWTAKLLVGKHSTVKPA